MNYYKENYLIFSVKRKFLYIIILFIALFLNISSCKYPGSRISQTSTNGEVLYNGIQLPEVWPPKHFHPESTAVMPVPYLEHPPKVIPIDVGRQLFVDDFLIQETDLKRTYYRAEKYSGNPVFKPETEEELKKNSAVYLGHGGVFYDFSEQLYKMYYSAGWRGGLAEATSRDMIHWTRPEIISGKGNVLIDRSVDDNSIWLDLATSKPDERLKFLECHRNKMTGIQEPGHYLYTSEDGKDWSDGFLAGKASDYCSFFYNPFRKVWVFSIKRDHPIRGRCRYYFENVDFIKGTDWSNAVYWTNADNLDKPEPADRYPGAGEEPQLYSLNAVAYESIMIGMHYILRGPNNEICNKGNFPKLTDLELGFSRDGFHWSRPDRQGFIVGSRTEGAWDRAYLHSTAGVFVIDQDKLIFPYTAFSGIAADGSHGMYNGASIGLAFLRRDGFASMDAGHEKGTLTTRLVKFTGEYIFVNVDCPQGELRIEVLDESDRVIDSFSANNCQPINQDKTLLEVKWNGAENLSSLKGKNVKFRFHLRNGKLYSFWLSSSKNGASSGYLGAGGSGYNGLIDTNIKAAYKTKE